MRSWLKDRGLWCSESRQMVIGFGPQVSQRDLIESVTDAVDDMRDRAGFLAKLDPVFLRQGSDEAHIDGAHHVDDGADVPDAGALEIERGLVGFGAKEALPRAADVLSGDKCS